MRTKRAIAKDAIDPRQAVRDLLQAAGYLPAGHTESETVRIPTMKAPVFGGLGGEVRAFGGRERFALPDSPKRATVGKRTVCLYEVHITDVIEPCVTNVRRSPQTPYSRVANSRNYRTRDVDAIRAALQQPLPNNGTRSADTSASAHETC